MSPRACSAKAGWSNRPKSLPASTPSRSTTCVRPARPFTALRECVEVVDALLRGQTVDHAGEFEAHGALSWCPGGLPLVNYYDGGGTLLRSFLAYDAGFRGGVRVVTTDMNRDGVADIITAPGPGGGPHVKLFDGVTGQVLSVAGGITARQ